ncbi:MAG: outer membrane protein assembly factor BamE [Burkholderiales bacterium]|nr:outer membrane protein assembly factor BamE [Burkholderiales bacterium]
MFSKSKSETILRGLAAAGLAALVVACAPQGDFRQLSGRDVAAVQVGMTSEEVRKALGEPRVGRNRQGQTVYTYRFEDLALVPPFRELYVMIDPASGKVVSITSGTDPSRDVAGR